MATENQEIDLYADDIGEEEFSQENEYGEGQGLDLYDDVITPSAPGGGGGNSNKSSHQSSQDDYGLNDNANSHSHHHQHHNNNSSDMGLDGVGSGKKIGIYVGNLSWWTTDQDVVDSIQELGIGDLFEVKFFENRANGQSKGFCVVTLGSENSVRAVLDKLPKTEIHGQNPVVTNCNRQNLNHFEMQSRKTSPGSSGGNQHLGGGNQGNYGGPRNFPQSGGMRPPLISRPQRPNGPLIPGQPRMPMAPHQSMPYGQNQPQWGPGMPPGSAPPRPQAPMHPGAPPRPGMPMMRMPNQGPGQRGPGPQQPLLRGPTPDPRVPHPQGPPMQEWAGNDHSGPHQPPQQQMGMPQGQQQNASMQARPQVSSATSSVSGMPIGAPHPGGPAPHVNPAFFPPPHHQGVPPQQGDYGRMGGPGQYGGHDYRMGGGDVAISEQEFEEIMNKNRTVSSGAISRAVADASAGEYAAAIETLVTAISLIKQSKVAHDERCKILISSLQDTLHGIEAKSYGSASGRSKDRPRSRERSRDRERSGRREKSSRRDRSRSRERDYRDRSRDRDRYHDDRYHESDRYREKERDRDRHGRH